MVSMKGMENSTNIEEKEQTLDVLGALLYNNKPLKNVPKELEKQWKKINSMQTCQVKVILLRVYITFRKKQILNHKW